MKKVNLISLLSLFSLSLVSAYGTVGGSFNSFSLMNFLNNFDTSLLLLALIFLGVFWALNKGLQKAGFAYKLIIQTFKVT
jgi:fumarate reductase subunit D